jgi:glutathione S-transferase
MKYFAFVSFALLATNTANAFSSLKSLTSTSPRNVAPKPSSTALNAITLYGHPGTRSPLCNWGAYEAGLEITPGDLSQNPHPFGQIPCLTDDDGVLVFESGAILLYFHELTKNDQSLTKAQAAAVQSWITWANASLDPICFLETPDGKVYDTGLKKPNKKIDTVNELLGKQAYLAGDDVDTFSLADVAVASYFLYVLQFFPGTDLSRWPNVVRYLKDCVTRPAYTKAFGERMQASLLAQLDQEPKKKMFGVF